MLGTLMKHEWKYIWKKFVLFLSVLAFATLVGVVSFAKLNSFGDDPGVTKTLTVIIGILGYYGLIIAVSYGFLILSGVRFYKNVYGDEAYITHTLPVTAREIHVSKVIIYSICTSVVSAGIAVSVFAVLNTTLYSTANGVDEWSNFINAFGLSNTGLVWAFLTVMTLISSFSNVSCVFCAIVLGQYWKKQKVLGAVVWYAVLTFITSILATIFTLPVIGNAIMEEAANSMEYEMTSGAINTYNGPIDGMMGILISSTIISLIVGVTYFLIADHGLNKKLNLE